MKIVELESVGSTNSWVAAHVGEMEGTTMVAARSQSAGRGQRGNSWEAEPGCNLTLSVFLRPPMGFHPRSQFSISEAVALGVADTLGLFGIEAAVKWPNDIYVGDRKIAGILIEHSLLGPSIQHTIAGIGLNVNQERFLSPAPNPVSMTNVAGRRFSLAEVRERLAENLERRFEETWDPKKRENLHTEFQRRMWRGDGRAWPFRDRASGETFKACIENVEPSGMLNLRTDSELRSYAFKEVEFLL